MGKYLLSCDENGSCRGASPSVLASGEKYGYPIIQHVTEISGATLEWSEGMLYPVLHRMEKDGFILSRWRISENGRKRKYYSMTALGREELENHLRDKVDDLKSQGLSFISDSIQKSELAQAAGPNVC